MILSGTLNAAVPADPLLTLRKTHPRLLAPESAIERIRASIRAHPLARRIYDDMRARARSYDSLPVVAHEVRDGRLAPSGVCADRITTLAMLYRLDREPRYLDRAVRELRAVAAFPDWGLDHFLDTTYIMQGVALGYDWLYSELSAADRAAIRRAIVEKGLRRALERYQEPRGWTKRRFNLNLLHNSGVGLASLAIADEEPELCRDLMRRALASIPLALATYGPDGGWPEGPGYWNFGSNAAVTFIAALETALGADFGLAETSGFSRAGRFRIYAEGPTGKSFNFADSGERVGRGVQLFWLARRFREPVYAWMAAQLFKTAPDASAAALAWFEPEGESPEQARWPLDVLFTGVDVAFMRSSWSDPLALFAGVKGGDNSGAHAHLDLGTFVLDAGGHRWALDPGADSYSLPAYHGSRRWTYYRKRSESHNVMLIDGENQDPAAKAPIIAHSFTPERAEVRIDLAAAYPGKVKRFERSLAMLERRAVVITDVLESDVAREALWSMATDAEVVCKGDRAELRKPGWILAARIHSPAGAVFGVASTYAPPPQNPNTGTRKLVVRLPGKVTNLRLTVSLSLKNRD